MPVSHNSNVEYAVTLIGKANPETTLDIGAGAGKYGHLVRAMLPYSTIHAVEVWDPYVSAFKLRSLYDKVIKHDVRKIHNFNYDLVIMGDVLEHMTKEDAVAVMDQVKAQARCAIISIPICPMPQGHVHDNPYEEHIKDDWTHEEVMETFSNIFEYQLFDETATYFLDYREYESVV